MQEGAQDRKQSTPYLADFGPDPSRAIAILFSRCVGAASAVCQTLPAWKRRDKKFGFKIAVPYNGTLS